MCGVAGFELSGEVQDRLAASALLSSLARRGPDGGWSERREPYMLVQTRLAVIDLSERVRYPMSNETNDVWLLFNGEIYDHVAVRRELANRGHRFKTDCDAEVILHGYEEWGVGIFSRVDGMFAVAVWD